MKAAAFTLRAVTAFQSVSLRSAHPGLQRKNRAMYVCELSFLSSLERKLSFQKPPKERRGF